MNIGNNLINPGILNSLIDSRSCSIADNASLSSVNRKSQLIWKPIWKRLLDQDQENRKIIGFYDEIISRVPLDRARLIYFQIKQCTKHITNFNEFRLKGRIILYTQKPDSEASKMAITVDKAELVFEAARENCEAFLGLLIEAGFDRDINFHDYAPYFCASACTKHYVTALMVAVLQNKNASYSVGIVRALIAARADCNVEDKGQTALMHATEAEDLEILKALLASRQVNLEAQNEYNETALMHAARRKNIEAMKLLISSKANIETRDSFDKTILLCAAGRGNLRVVDLLLCQGAQIEAQDCQGRTALLCAACSESVVDLQIEDRMLHGRTTLMYAAEIGRLPVVDLLLQKGAQKEARDDTDQTALLCAARAGNTSIVERLLQYGAQIETRDIYGQTSLMLARRRNFAGVVNVLIRAGAHQGFRAFLDTCVWNRGLIFGISSKILLLSFIYTLFAKIARRGR